MSYYPKNSTVDRRGFYDNKGLSKEESVSERTERQWNLNTDEEESDELYYQMPTFNQMLEIQKEEERDLRRLQSIYPESAKVILPYVEEACDKMEYEGSVMFDVFPDPTFIWKMQNQIQSQINGRYASEKTDMEEKNWMGDLIRVMLLEEIHHRRCRHAKSHCNRI